MAFTSVPTHLFSGGFFNFWAASPTFTSLSELNQAQAAEQAPLEDCALCSDAHRCEEHRFERSLRSETDDRYQIAPEDFYFSNESTSDFIDLELVEISEDSNIFFDAVSGEEIEEFFSTPVRVEDADGYFIEIDPSLVTSDETNFVYETAVGDMMNFFPEVIDEVTPFLLTYQDFEIRFALITDEEVTLSEIEDLEFADIFEEVDERPLAALYNIDEDKDFRVTSSDIGIKSEFVLSALPESNIFSYELHLTGLRAELFEDASSVLLFCVDSDEEPVAVIPEGIMWDSSSNGAYSNDIEYALERLGPGRYILSLIVCEEYLNSETRVFPITVDPTITWQGTFGSRDDGRGFTTHWVRSGADADTVIGNTYSLPIGRGATTGRVHRSFMRGDNINATLRHRTINSATLHLTQRTTASGISVSVRRVNDPTDTQTNAYGQMTWNNQPGSTEITTFSTRAARTVHSINVLTWARDVASGARTGRGFSLRAVNTDQYAEFYGARDVHGSRRPRIVVAMAAPAAPATLSISNPHARLRQDQTISWGTIAPSQHIRRVEYRLYRNVAATDGTHSATGTLVASGTLRNVTNGNAGSAALPNANTLVQGCYRVRVRGVDSEGVAGAWRNVYFHLDNAPPVLNLSQTPITPITSANSFSNQLPEVHWDSATDTPICDARRVSIQVRAIRPDGTTTNWREVANALSHDAGSAAFSATELPANSPGIYTLEIRAVDRAGNASPTRNFTYFYDAVAPTIENVGLYPQAPSGWHTDTVPYITWQNLDDLPQFDGNSYRLEVAINREDQPIPDFSELVPQTAFSIPHTPVSGQSDMPLSFFSELCDGGKPLCGRYEVRLRAIDYAGNVGLYNNIQYWVDRTAPELSVSVENPHNMDIPLASSEYHTHFTRAPIVGGSVRFDFQIDNECPDNIRTSGFDTRFGKNGKWEIVGLSAGATRLRSEYLGQSRSTTLPFNTACPINGLNDGIYRMTFSGQDHAGNEAEPAIMYFEVENAFPRPTVRRSLGTDLTNNSGNFFLEWEFTTPRWNGDAVTGIQWAIVSSNANIEDRDFLNSLDWTSVYSPSPALSRMGNFTATTPHNQDGSPQEGRFILLTRAILAGDEDSFTQIQSTVLRVRITAPEVAITSFSAGIITGIIEGEYLNNYEVFIKKSTASDEDFERIAEGQARAGTSVLGFVDLARDYPAGYFYTLRLKAYDMAGNYDYYDFAVYNALPDTLLSNSVDLSLELPLNGIISSREATIDVVGESALNFSSFNWFIDGVSRQSNDTVSTPPVFTDDFAYQAYYPEGSYHTIFGTTESRTQWQSGTPEATTARSGSAIISFADRSSFETYSGGNFSSDGTKFTLNSEAQVAQLITPQITTALPFISATLNTLGEHTRAYISVDGQDWVPFQSATDTHLWHLGVEKDAVYATSFRLKIESSATQGIDLSNFDITFNFISPDIFHIDFLSAATPINFSVRDRLDLRTHFYWTSSDARPDDLTYEIYYVQSISDITAENIAMVHWERVAVGLSENYFATPNLHFSENFFYRLLPVRTKYEDGVQVSRVVGTPSVIRASRVADENEFTKRLGIQDYWAYETIDTPIGVVSVEKTMGNMVFQQTDRELEFDIMLQDGITRTHNSQSSLLYSFGQGTSFTYGVELIRQWRTNDDIYEEERYLDGDIALANYRYIFKDETGTLRTFVQDGQGTFFTHDSKRIRLTSFDDPVRISVRTAFGTEDNPHQYEDLLVGYVVTSHRKREYWFNQGGQLIYITEKPGQLTAALAEDATYRRADHSSPNLTFTYCSTSGLIQSATSRGMRTIHFAHNDDRQISAIWLPDRLAENGTGIIGSVITYAYDEYTGQRLIEVRQHANTISEEDFLNHRNAGTDVVSVVGISSQDIYHSYRWESENYWRRDGGFLNNLIGALLFPTSPFDRHYIAEISSMPRGSGAEQEIPRTTFSYNPDSNPVSVVAATNPLGDRTAFNYDSEMTSAGRLYFTTNVLRTPYGASTPAAETVSRASHLGHPVRTEVGTPDDIAQGSAQVIEQRWSNHLLDAIYTSVEYHTLSEDGTVITNRAQNYTRTEHNALRLPTVTIECSGVRILKEYTGTGINDEEVTEEKVIDSEGNIDCWMKWDFCDDGFEVFEAEISYDLVTTRAYFPDGTLHYELVSQQRYEDWVAVGEPVVQSRTVFSYDIWGNTTSEVRTEYGEINTVHETHQTFDWKGRVITERTGMRVGTTLREERTTTNVYDIFGRQTNSTVRELDTNGVETVRETFIYFNPDGSIAAEIDELGIRTDFVYDISGRVISTTVTDSADAEPRVSVVEYGLADEIEIFSPEGTRIYANVQTTTNIDPAGLVTRAYLDVFGRTIRLSASGVNTDTTFTACDKTFAVITSPEGGVREDARIGLSLHDRLGNETHTIDRPEFAYGSFRVADETVVTSSEFDDFGRVIATTDGVGNTTRFTHDSSGEMASATFPVADHIMPNSREVERAAATVTFINEEVSEDVNDGAGGTRSTAINALGYRSITESDADGRVMSISDLGRTTAEATLDDLRPVTTSYEYNAQDQLIRETFSNGNYKTFAYDAAGNLIRTEHRNATTDPSTVELTTVNTFDRHNRIISTTDYSGVPAAESVIYHQTFTYDVAGKLIASFEGHSRPENVTEAQLTRFHFDAADRITGIDFPILPALEVQNGQQSASEDAVQIAASGNFTIALLADGTLWSWGNNDFGQLGLGDNTQRATPVMIPDTGVSGDRWISVSAGVNHVMALRDTGELYGWGGNANGRLGTGNTTNQSLPVQVSTTGVSGDSWTKIKAGRSSTVGIRDDGSMWSWGAGTSGQLGNGTATQRTTPTKVSDADISGNTWIYVDIGSHHTLAVRDNGKLYVWGAGNNGRLGLGDNSEQLLPIQLDDTNISGDSWVSASAGDGHSLAIRDDGSMWAWGNNSAGRLGLGNSVQRNVPYEVVTTGVSGSAWTTVSAFNTHSAALRDSGELYVWGTNTSGQLGLGDIIMRGIPTRLGSANSDGNNWAALSLGAAALHTTAARDSGSLWSWGSNTHGQLGKGFVGDGDDAGISNRIPQRIDSLPQVNSSGSQTSLQSESITLLGQRFSFDHFGRLDTIYARLKVDGSVISTPLRQYSYDSWNRVSELRDFNIARRDGSYILKSYTYDDFGRVINISYALNAGNTNAIPSFVAELTGHNTSTGDVFESFTYTFSKNSSITSERHVVALPDAPPRDETRYYTYDTMDRLIKSETVQNDDDSVEPVINEYGWDKAGNRRMTSIDGVVEWSEFNGLNQLTSKYNVNTGTTTYYQHCPNGNQILEYILVGDQRLGRSFHYNVDNRLIDVREGGIDAADRAQNSINANTFRGDGQRISRVELDRHTNYIYQGGTVLFTADDSGNLINFHINTPDGTLISKMHYRNDGNPFSNFTTDLRRSIHTVLDARGEFSTGFRYTDFGETTRLVDTYELHEVAYTGGIWDESTGLYYLNARFYNPVDAVFLTMDTERNGGDLRATLSLYGYTEGNPINKIDPSGHIAFIPFLVIGAKKLGGFAVKKGGAALARRAAAQAARRAAQRAAQQRARQLAAQRARAAAQRRAAALARQRARAAAQRRAAQAARQRAAAEARRVAQQRAREAAQRARAAAQQRARAAAQRAREAAQRARQQAQQRAQQQAQQRAQQQGCFVAGTLVKTKYGHVPIEQIEVGDYVYAKDPATGEVGLRPVVATFRFESNTLIRIEVDGHYIKATPYHPFYTPDRGWIAAAELRPDDRVLLSDGRVMSVCEVQLYKADIPVFVYNFTVGGKYTYFVSSSNVLVHNKAMRARPNSPNRVSDGLLRREGIDAHALKREVLGRNANISHWNIHRDKATGQLWLRNNNSGAWERAFRTINPR